MSRQLVVSVTCGPESAERLSQALTVAATAVAAGVDVVVWLSGDATWMAVPGHAEQVTLPHAASFADLRDTVLAAGDLVVCTQCAARRDLTESDLVPGARIAGAASLVEHITRDGVQALVY